MSIIIKSISNAFGDPVGTRHDDFKDILGKAEFGGGTNIKKIDIKRIGEVRAGTALDSIQFVYNVVTNDGKSHEYTGVKWGGTGGGPRDPVDFTDKQITGIGGRFGTEKGVCIRYLEFQTSQGKFSYGILNPADTEFTLPPGVPFGSSDIFVRSIGVYEIAEAKQLVNTVTSSITEISSITEKPTKTVTLIVAESTETVAATENTFVDNSRAIIGLSVPLAVFSTILLAVLFYKYKKKNTPLGVAGSQPA